VRLPDKQSIMLPSLDGNVTDAWFSTTFNLNQARNHFRRHDLLLSVNDVWIKMFQNTVPEGRYLFHLNPNQVFTSPGKPVPNRISIHSWHMNPGHYSSNTGYELGVRMSWSEHYVFAANEEDAKRSVTSEHVNHDQPDLGLFANAADLPIDMPKPGRINIPILIANLGEAPSLLTRLVMYRGEGTTQQLASVPVPAIKQGEEKTVVMPLDYDGKMPSIYFRLEDNKDFDPSNDELNLVLWEPLPTAYDGPDPNFPKVPLELKVTVGGQPAYQYDALDAFTNRVIAKIENGEQRGALRTGAYHVAVKPYGSEGQQTLFTDEIDHQAGVTQQVDFKSGIKIEPADVASKISRWSAARADNPGTTAQWQSGSHSFMALAPGEYLVELQSADTGSSTVWPQRIQVLPGQQTTLSINSGLRLAVAPELVSTLNRWQLVPFGNPSQVIQDLSRDTLTGIVPPGEYLIKSVGHGTYNWITWPQKIQVQPGQQATFAINSSLRLDVPADVINTLNRWQVVRFGNASEVIEDLDRDHRTTILPPGEYQIKSVGHGTYNWITWPQKIQVQPGQQATFAINSSLRLDVPADVINTLNRWQVVRFGNASEVIEDLDRDHRTTILPPGDYQIISLAQGTYDWVTWPQKIHVSVGSTGALKLDSGIRLVGPGIGRNYYFSVLDASGRTVEEWQSNAFQLLPLGKYAIEARADGAQAWKRIADGAEVRPGSLTDINVPVLQK